MLVVGMDERRGCEEEREGKRECGAGSNEIGVDKRWGGGWYPIGLVEGSKSERARERRSQTVRQAARQARKAGRQARKAGRQAGRQAGSAEQSQDH
ncbi:hypothetical protein M0802_012331 [Mischocyttarus mexicanus]|nr:hypothetical protein M0802_012331 [Mischocyttarus mexicanus]